jgi:hypothetical protein
MRKNYIALGMFLILCLFVVSVSPTQGALIRSGISGNSWLVTTTQSTELTVTEAELYTHADLYDESKGLHITLPRSEGTLVNLQSIIRNDNDAPYNIAAGSLFRYKVGSDSWVEFDRWNTSGVLNSHETITGNTEPQDLTRLGFWDTGNQIHIALGVVASPVSDPSDEVAIGWALWITIADSSDSGSNDGNNNGNGGSDSGDSTTNDNNEYSDHSYDGLLSVFDAGTPIFGSTLGVLIVIGLCALIVITVISVIMTDEE